MSKTRIDASSSIKSSLAEHHDDIADKSFYICFNIRTLLFKDSKIDYQISDEPATPDSVLKGTEMNHISDRVRRGRGVGQKLVRVYPTGCWDGNMFFFVENNILPRVLGKIWTRNIIVIRSFSPKHCNTPSHPAVGNAAWFKIGYGRHYGLVYKNPPNKKKTSRKSFPKRVAVTRRGRGSTGRRGRPRRVTGDSVNGNRTAVFRRTLRKHARRRILSPGTTRRHDAVAPPPLQTVCAVVPDVHGERSGFPSVSPSQARRQKFVRKAAEMFGLFLFVNPYPSPSTFPLFS